MAPHFPVGVEAGPPTGLASARPEPLARRSPLGMENGAVSGVPEPSDPSSQAASAPQRAAALNSTGNDGATGSEVPPASGGGRVGAAAIGLAAGQWR